MNEDEFKQSLEGLKTTGIFDSIGPMMKRRLAEYQANAQPGDNDVVQTFSIRGIEQRKINVWIQEHDAVCPFSDPTNQGAIGGRLAYTFCHTMLGQVVKVSCGCGAEVDASDYESW